MRLTKFAAAMAALLSAVTAAHAMDADTAKSFLQGTWSAASETWIFTGDRWQQFNGGVTTDTTFEVEEMPADMFVVISGHAGRRYVVHAKPEYGTMTWFPEGETQQLGFYTRRK